MQTSMCKCLRASICALAIAAWSVQLARANVTLDLTPSTLSTFPGGSIEFIGTLTNTGTTNVFLNGDVSILPYTSLTLDDSPFFINSPSFLLPGETYVGPFFDVLANTTALSGSCSGSFTTQGGADSNTFDNLAAQKFTVNVVSIVAEPNFSTLLGIALTVIVAGPCIRRSLKSSVARK